MTAELFRPVRLGTLSLPNRFVRSATWEGMCDAEGRPTERLLQLHRQLAEGGVGLSIAGYAAVHPLGLQLPGGLRLDRDETVAGCRQLTAAVHAAGGTIFAQLFHGGGQSGMRFLGRPGLAPSAIAFPSYDGIPAEMSGDDIGEILQAFGRAARRARDAGFDGVQLHAAHGYLIHQFLSPLTNHRLDRFGGTPERRLRFLLQACDAVRDHAAGDFPLAVKLNACDHEAGGFTPEDAAVAAQALEAIGVCAIEVSSGWPTSGALSPVRTGLRPAADEAYNAAFARQVRAAVSIPVITVGGLRHLETAEALFADGAADLFALSRPLIREPGLILRWQQGDVRPARCTSCNGCFRPGLKEGGIACVLERQPPTAAD